VTVLDGEVTEYVRQYLAPGLEVGGLKRDPRTGSHARQRLYLRRQVRGGLGEPREREFQSHPLVLEFDGLLVIRPTLGSHEVVTQDAGALVGLSSVWFVKAATPARTAQGETRAPRVLG